MVEVEIRAKIDSFENIKSRLKEKGAEFIDSKHQIDKIFGHPMFLDDKKMVVEGGLVARIRKVNDKKTLEFKEISRKSGGIEIKSKLDDLKEGVKFLNKLKFEEAFTIDKKRDLYKYKDFSICLDQVEKLGKFIEIEKMISIDDEMNKQKAKQECVNLLSFLSPNSEITNKKYGDLVQEIINQEK